MINFSEISLWMYIILAIVLTIIGFIIKCYWDNLRSRKNSLIRRGGKPKKNVQYMIMTDNFENDGFSKEISDSFVKEVPEIISNSGWNDKYNITRLNENKTKEKYISIYLWPRNRMIEQFKSVERVCKNGKNDDIYFSITTQSPSRPPEIYIDYDNWAYGCERSKLSLEKYREYVITHELGHGLGYDHQPCNVDASGVVVCPVMYQSTRGCPEGTQCGFSVTSADYTKKILGRYFW